MPPSCPYNTPGYNAAHPDFGEHTVLPPNAQFIHRLPALAWRSCTPHAFFPCVYNKLTLGPNRMNPFQSGPSEQRDYCSRGHRSDSDEWMDTATMWNNVQTRGEELQRRRRLQPASASCTGVDWMAGPRRLRKRVQTQVRAGGRGGRQSG